MPLKISNLNHFGLCTDSQNRGTSVDHHIYTRTIFGLSTIFCMCCAFVSVVTVVYFAVSFLYFAVGFLYFAVSFLYCAVRFFLFSRDFLYSVMSFLCFAVVSFFLPWAFFILPWLCLCWRDFNYIAVVLFFLPWQLWATITRRWLVS